MNNIGLDWLLIIGDNLYFLFLSYALLGAGIKCIDAAYDDNVFSKKTALIIAPGLGLLWAGAMLIDPISATILFAVLLGVLVKGKIDNHAHLIGFFIILIIIVIVRVEFLILPLIFLTAAAALDEVGNDVTGYNKKLLSNNSFRHQLVLYLFGRRYIMKIGLLFLLLLGLFPWYFLLAFIFFDEAYIIVGLYSQSGRRTSSS